MSLSGGTISDVGVKKKITHGFYDLSFEVLEKKLADGVVCLSSAMEERARQLKINTKTIVITGGCDTRAIPFYQTTAYKQKYNIPNHSLTFGFVGMTRGEYADILPFIKAVDILKKRGINVSWFTTGDFLISETEKRKHNIGEELIEFGWVGYDLFPEILSCADVFLLLQREDLKNMTRWPNKIGDYLAAGRPILTNPYGEMVKLVEKNSDFFLVADYDVNSIVRTIKQHLKGNKSVATHDEIRAYAENEFSWKKRAEQLIAFYEYARNERKIQENTA